MSIGLAVLACISAAILIYIAVLLERIITLLGVILRALNRCE